MSVPVIFILPCLSDHLGDSSYCPGGASGIIARSLDAPRASRILAPSSPAMLSEAARSTASRNPISLDLPAALACTRPKWAPSCRMRNHRYSMITFVRPEPYAMAVGCHDPRGTAASRIHVFSPTCIESRPRWPRSSSYGITSSMVTAIPSRTALAMSRETRLPCEYTSPE